MRAHIDESANLRVVPETPGEALMLDYWFMAFMGQLSGNRSAGLEIGANAANPAPRQDSRANDEGHPPYGPGLALPGLGTCIRRHQGNNGGGVRQPDFMGVITQPCRAAPSSNRPFSNYGPLMATYPLFPSVRSPI